MLVALVLLAQISAAAPSPALGPGAAAVSAKPKSLSDIARERKLVKPTGTGTFSVTGAEGMPVLLAPVYGEGGSFQEVDRSDAAHRPVPAAPAYTAYDPYWPNFYPNGYGGTRTHFRTQHSYSAPSVPRAPVAPAPALAPRAPSHSTGGLSMGHSTSRRTR